MGALIPLVLSLAWFVVVVRRAVKWQGFNEHTIACAVFLVITCAHTELGVTGLARLGVTAALPVHLAWVLGLALTWRWLSVGLFGAFEPPYSFVSRWISVGVLAPALTLVWLAATCLSNVPAALLALLYWYGLNALLGVLGLAVLSLGVAAAFTTRGRRRLSLLFIAAAGAVTAEATLVGILTLIREVPGPSVSLLAQTDLATGLSWFDGSALTLLWLGAMLPLFPRRPHQRDASINPALEALWSWLSPNKPQMRIDESDTSVAGSWVADAVIDLRDRIRTLQQWASEDEQTRAYLAARRNGLSARQARAAAAAECLWLALRAEARDPDGDYAPADHAQVDALGGGRRLEDEIAWLMDLHEAMTLITGTGRTRPVSGSGGAGSLLCDPEVVERCEDHADRWLPSPRPATLSALVAYVGKKRGRPIRIVQRRGFPVRSIWIPGPDCDLIYMEKQLSPFMHIVAVGHELGHLMADHEAQPLDTPAPVKDLDAALLAATPALAPEVVLGLRGLGRCLRDHDWRTHPVEVEAELIGRATVRNLLHMPDSGLASFLD